MNNDKRIILAIALYAAVMIMVLHTLTSEGHQRINQTEISAMEYVFTQCESADDLQSHENTCADDKCLNAEDVFAKETSISTQSKIYPAMIDG